MPTQEIHFGVCTNQLTDQQHCKYLRQLNCSNFAAPVLESGVTTQDTHREEEQEDGYDHNENPGENEGHGEFGTVLEADDDETLGTHRPSEDVVFGQENKTESSGEEQNVHLASSAIGRGEMTRVTLLKTFKNTKVYIPVVVPQKIVKQRSNKTEEVKGERGPSKNIPVTSVVQASSKLSVRNTSVKPLKYDENFTILVAKRNKVVEAEKGNSTAVNQTVSKRAKRGSPYRYDSSDDDRDYQSKESGEYGGSSTRMQEADHEYDGDYEYVKNTDDDRSGESESDDDHSGIGSYDSTPSYEDDTGNYDSGPSAPDAYDIHGYRGDEQKTTQWPPSRVQPAYALAEGQTPAPHMKSRRPQTFKQPLRNYGYGHHKHPGGAVSSSNFNMGGDEHHHHHFYDKLKESHENKPKYYHHTTKFLIPPEIYRKYPGKHKHFHHLKTPEGQKVIEESEEDVNFDPNTLTDKDHEEAYKTYDEEEIAVDEDYDSGKHKKSGPPRSAAGPRRTRMKPTHSSSSKPKPKPVLLEPTYPATSKHDRFTKKHVVMYRQPRVSKMGGTGHKAEVERIFQTVEKAMRIDRMSSNMGAKGHAILWPLGYPKGLPVKQ